MPRKKDDKHITLFFTQDISLQTWKDTGLFEREVMPYLILAKEHGWTITFVTYGMTSDLTYADELSPIKIVPIWKDHPPKSRLGKVLAAPFALLKLRDDIGDAAIYKTNQFWGGWNAIFAKWIWGGRVIARQGYEYLAFARQQKKPAHQRLIAWALEYFIYRFADRVVLATESDKDFAVKTFPFLKKKPIDIQPNWIDIEAFKPHPAKGQSADFIYIGRLNAQKNLHAMIEAAAVADCSIDIYGEGELEDELRSLAKMQRACVQFKGCVPNSEIPQLLRSYTGFILPSFFEGNPKALLEAMACGMPVIGTDVPGIRDVLTHGENGVLCETDIGGIAHAMSTLMSDTNLREKCGANARQTIVDGYSLAYFIACEGARYKAINNYE